MEGERTSPQAVGPYDRAVLSSSLTKKVKQASAELNLLFRKIARWCVCAVRGSTATLNSDRAHPHIVQVLQSRRCGTIGLSAENHRSGGEPAADKICRGAPIDGHLERGIRGRSSELDRSPTSSQQGFSRVGQGPIAHKALTNTTPPSLRGSHCFHMSSNEHSEQSTRVMVGIRCMKQYTIHLWGALAPPWRIAHMSQAGKINARMPCGKVLPPPAVERWAEESSVNIWRAPPPSVHWMRQRSHHFWC